LQGSIRVWPAWGGGGWMQHAKDEDGAAPAKTYGPQWMYH